MKPEQLEPPKNEQQQHYLDVTGAESLLNTRYSREEIVRRAAEEARAPWQQYFVEANKINQTLALDQGHKDKFGGRDTIVIGKLTELGRENAVGAGVVPEEIDKYIESLQS